MCGGGGGGGEVELTDAEKAAHQQMEKDAKQQTEKAKKIIKMLLLGAGESGKSTIFKQMKVINKEGFTKAELKEYVSIVHSNVCQSMKNLFGAFDKLEVDLPSDLAAMKEEFATAGASEKLTPELGALITKIWSHEAIKAVFQRRSEFQLNDSAEHYFDNVERLSTADYLPTTDDVLRSRVRTTGIVQSDFHIKSIDFSMFDVGGQRNERRKWIHCFDNVDAVVFVASLSEFDQVLFEDESQNRLDEALDLFRQIVNSKWFKETAIVLFLNKKDLFEKKLLEKTFADYVNKNESRERYEGPNQLAECSDYIKKQFLSKNTNPDKSIFTHITTAIDTSNVKFVFNAVVGIILEANLKASGLAG